MGITVLVVTHEHELVHRFHQRVVTLSHGRIVSDVPADPVAAAEDDLSLDVAAFDADDASAAKKEVAAVLCDPLLSFSLPGAVCATWASTGL